MKIHSPRERILSDLSVYTRFTTPRISLSELLSQDCESSPLIRLNKLWSKPQKNKDWRTRVIYELKTLVNIVLSETGSMIESSVFQEPEISDEIIDSISKLLSSMQKHKKPFPGKIRQPLIWTLEALTMLICDYYINALESLEGWERLLFRQKTEETLRSFSDPHPAPEEEVRLGYPCGSA